MAYETTAHCEVWEHSVKISGNERVCVMSGLLVRFFLFFIPCTSSILLNEHCGNTPRTREKWMFMMDLESAHILWVVV